LKKYIKSIPIKGVISTS